MGKHTDKPKAASGANSAGHVVMDSRGRNVWQWKGEQIDNTSILLKRLDNDALELEPTQSVPVQKSAENRPDRARPQSQSGTSTDADRKLAEQLTGKEGCSFDPYNSSS